MSEMFIIDNLMRHVGQTVTIFTTSGGLSGSGFTGILAGVHGGCVRLITDIGAPPACPVGSSCDGCWGDRCERGTPFPGFDGRRGWGWNQRWRGTAGCGWGANRWGWGGFNWLGSVAEIPINKIVNFTRNAI